MRRTTPAPSREPCEPIATYGDLNRSPPATGAKKFRVCDARYARSPHARRAIRSVSDAPESSKERFQRLSAISRRIRRAASDRTHRRASSSEPFSSNSADNVSTLNASNGLSTFAADASREAYATRCAAASSSFNSRSGGAAADTSTPAAGFSASPPRACTARTRRTLSIVTARD